jgi:hypothetical protein
LLSSLSGQKALVFSQLCRSTSSFPRSRPRASSLSSTGRRGILESLVQRREDPTLGVPPDEIPKAGGVGLNLTAAE